MELHFPNNFTGWTEQEQKSYRENQEKVLFEHVYPLLEWNTLLLLRLVGKATKKLVDKYLREGEGFKRCPEITIHERSECEDRSMEAFLRMNIPSTAIYLVNVTGNKYFDRESDEIEAFLQNEMLSKKITCLRVRKLSSYPNGMEGRLYGGLDNLETLESDDFGLSFATQEEVDELSNELELDKNSENRKKLVEMLTRLKKFVLGVRKPDDPWKVYCNMFIASNALMDKCPNLEYAGDAFSSYMDFRFGDEDRWKNLGIIFRMILERVEKVSKNLKFYDFAGFYVDSDAQEKAVCWLNAPDFFQLLTLCAKRGIQMYNVYAGWFNGPLDGFDWSEVTLPIVSMVNLHGNAVSKVVNTENRQAVPVPMPNLEKVVITSTSKSCLFTEKGAVSRMNWPKLRVLEVTVDSEMMGQQAIELKGISTISSVSSEIRKVDYRGIPAESTANLFRSLFMDIPRPTLVELSLSFVEGVRFEPVTKNVVGHLGTCCPNLKKLALVDWPGLGSLLKRALSELRHLEELTLDRCKRVRDDTFEIASLKNLKKLSLLNLESMPGITDAFFEDLLPQLQQLDDLTVDSERADSPTKLFRRRK